jgi:hypothetical protein
MKQIQAESDAMFAKYTTLKTAVQASEHGLVIEHKWGSPLAAEDYKRLKSDGFEIKVTESDGRVFALVTGELPGTGLIKE